MKCTKKNPACLQISAKFCDISVFVDFMKSESDFSGRKLFVLFSKIVLETSTQKRKQKLPNSN